MHKWKPLNQLPAFLSPFFFFLWLLAVYFLLGARYLSWGWLEILPDQGRALVLAWPEWMTSCFFMVWGARSWVLGLLGAWEDSAECSGDSNTVAMNGSVGFPQKKLAPQWPGQDWPWEVPGSGAWHLPGTQHFRRSCC